MFMNVTCPICGHKCRVPESALGQPVQCAGCFKFFQCGSISPRSLVAKLIPAKDAFATVETTPQGRAVQAGLTDKIHYLCSRCQHSLESPIQMAGQKLNCPNCEQRLQIPFAPPPVPVKVAAAAPVAPVTYVPTAAPPEAAKKKPKIVKVMAANPIAARPENCLECGVDVTERKRIQTCPDCGSLFCSARCFRDHRSHAHSSRG